MKNTIDIHQSDHRAIHLHSSVSSAKIRHFNFIFSHLLIITPIFAWWAQKFAKNIPHVLQNQKRVAKRNWKIILCAARHIEQKILSVPFFFLSLTSIFNFFSGRFQFLSSCYVDSPYVYFFGEWLKKSWEKNLVPSGQSINLSMFQQNRVWPVLEVNWKIKLKNREIDSLFDNHVARVLCSTA